MSTLVLSFVLFTESTIHGKQYPSKRLNERGRRQATRDLRAGNLRVRTYGYPSPYSWEYMKRLNERYGIEVIGVAGCIVSNRVKATTRGYNEVMEGAIEKRIGIGILDAVWEEARREYEAYSEFLSNPTESITERTAIKEMTLPPLLNVEIPPPPQPPPSKKKDQ